MTRLPSASSASIENLPVGKAVADHPGACRQRDLGVDRRTVGGRRRLAGLVDNRRDHRHKGGEQQAEIDRDEADQFPAHALDGRVERLFLDFVVEGLLRQRWNFRFR